VRRLPSEKLPPIDPRQKSPTEVDRLFAPLIDSRADVFVRRSAANWRRYDGKATMPAPKIASPTNVQKVVLQ
jgi:hypothetical protein